MVQERSRDPDVPVPRGLVSREAEVGGDDEAVEPVGTWRHLAFPMTVRARPRYADSSGAGLKRRLFEV